MEGLKKQMLRISLLLMLLSAGILCVYTIWNYNNNTAPTQSRMEPRSSFQSDIASQTPGGQRPDPTRRMAPHNGPMRGNITGAGAEYTPQLITYAILFLVAFAAAYYLFIYKKMKIDPGSEKLLILTLLCVGLLLRISASTLTQGHPFDINTFKIWATTAANNFFQVYASPRSSDYPPVYIYILFLIGKVAGIPAMTPYFTVLLKLPSMVADIATSLFIYRLARKHLSLEISMLAAAFYIFNPAIFLNSVFWGQVDSFFTLIVVSSLYMLSEKKPGPASVLFTAAVLMKPQGIIFLPVLFFELVRQRSFKVFVKAAFYALITATVIIVPFSLNNGVLWIFKLFSGTVAEYPYASVNAFNFFSLIGKNYAGDAATMFIFSYHTWGIFFIVLITAFSWFIYIKGKSSLFATAAALLQIAGVFTFSTRMHERYLFPAVALSILAFIYLRDKRLLLLSAGFSATVYGNTHFVLFETVSGINNLSFSPILIITSLINVLLFICLVKVLYDVAVLTKGNADAYINVFSVK